MGEESSDLVLELYGAFEPYDIPATDATRQDLYSVFLSRATSMRWSGAISPLPSVGSLWGMAEASLSQEALAAGGPVARFQVIAGDGRAIPLPIQPFVQCAVDSVRRLGDLRLDGLRFSVPLGLHGADGPRHIASTNWFHASRVGAEVTMAVSLSVAGELVSLAEEIARRHIEPFVVVPPHDAAPNVVCIVAPEWSAEATGWAASEIADAAVRLGIREHAIIEVRRDVGASA